MAGRLSNKTALVTAAAQGIGRATAEAFAAEGARVIATDINTAKLAELKGVEARRLDVLDPQAITAIAAELGTIDVLFNAAGFVHAGTILDATEAEWSFAFDLNVRSMFRTIKAFLPAALARADAGGPGMSIVNIASVAGTVKGVPNRFVYGTSKGAVIALTKAVAADYVTRKIRCNAICPGTTQTPSLDERIAALGDVEKARAAFIARQPMGRLGTPEEMAQLAVYLASDESVFMTGTAVVIDGGMVM